MYQGLRQSRPWLALVFVFFSLPLFLGLGRSDIDLDEAIYTFAVDRILETGDWLEPKSIPNEDWAFIEKPPLKFWIVAAPIRLGLLPHDEFGIRFWDALFGGVAFLYVFAIGARLISPWCGLVAVLLLFVHRPLLFDHGIRGNNMEAPLLLAYCGGVYHFMAWGRAGSVRERWRHVLLIAGFFVLGFMTKFVAVLFLPMVLGPVALLSSDYRSALRRDIRIWLAGVAVALLLIAPWFIWAFLRYGWFLWETMFGAHVYSRFTAYLDPNHLQPWHYYISTYWRVLGDVPTRALVVLGLAVLVVQAIRRRWPEGLTVVLWAVLPLVLISSGTSKIYHYIYPFLPPLALAAGYLVALPLLLAPAPLRRLLVWLQARLPGRLQRAGPATRRLLGAIALLGLVIATVTVITGPINLSLGRTTLFKSSGLLRPMAVAIVFGLLAGTIVRRRLWVVTVLVLSLLPFAGYRETFAQLTAATGPMRAARDCLLAVQRRVAGPGLYVDVPPEDLPHGVYYYFRRIRPWVRTAAPAPEALGPYLAEPARQRPALVSEAIYEQFMHTSGDRVGASMQVAPPPRALFYRTLLLTPGPYAACAGGGAAAPTGR